MASFFLAVCFFSLPSFASFGEIKTDAQWQALLHIPDTKSLILDSKFVEQVKYPEKLELQRAIAALGSESDEIKKQYLCRFPARSLWVRKHYPELLLPDPKRQCPELNTFLQRVPAEKITLVYAYENITQPASMMGHVFLKLSGTNTQDIYVEHAISFYTDTMTFNLPKLLFDSLVLGKKGHFMVSPYQDQLRQYNLVEQRNVIEYELLVDDFSRQLMQYHIWELKDVDLTYFFNRFNCATLTNDVIGIASPSVLVRSSDWLSPLDVVKASADSGLLGNPLLRASDSWKIRMLQDALSHQGVNGKEQIDNKESTQSLNDDQRFLLFSLEDSYFNYQLHTGVLSNASVSHVSEALKVKWDIQKEDQYIEISGYKDPLTRPQDSQLNISINNQDRLELEYIPTSHQLSDDHRSSFSESELKLLAFKGSVSTQDSSLRFEDITLYKMASFVPYDVFTGGLSKGFSVGATQLYDEDLKENLTPYMSGNIGVTLKLHDDFMVYSLLNFGLDESVTYGPEVGVFLYEIFSQKTTLSYSESHYQRKSNEVLRQLTIQQAWFFNKENSLVLHYQRNTSGDKEIKKIGIELRHYY